MLASKGTLPTAGRTALSTGYVATEINISHHALYIWLKQPTKQPTNQRNKHESYFVISTPFDKDKVRQLSSENVSVQTAICTHLTCNQYLEAVLPEILRSVQVER